MNLQANNLFDPFNVMQNAFPAFDRHAKINDAYHPYSFNQNWLHDFQSLQQQFLQGYWDWLTWRQWSWQQAFYDNARWFNHCLELTQEPKTLYRYNRMNWRKPYLGLSAQTLTSSRLLTKLWFDSFSVWQKYQH